MLKEQFRINDRVVMEMDAEARGWGRSGVPDGTLGTIVGKNRIKHYQERLGYHAKEPGVFEQDGDCIVKWDNGTESSGDDNSLELADKIEAKRRYDEEWCLPVFGARSRENNKRMKDGLYEETRNKLVNRVYLGPLPETKFWELDEVTIAPGARYRPQYGQIFEICSVDYYSLETERTNDRYPGILYNIESTINGEPSGGRFMLRESELLLSRRGNVWKYFHNELPAFKDLQEESSFHKMIGRSKEVRNPKTDLYSWTLEEILEAMKANLVHGFVMSPGLFGNPAKPSAMIFEDQELGERVRKATLAGFDATPVTLNN